MNAIVIFAWILIFTDILLGRILNNGESELIALMSFLTNTDFGMLNTFVVAAVMLFIQTNFGWMLTGVAFALFVLQFRIAGSSARPVIQK